MWGDIDRSNNRSHPRFVEIVGLGRDFRSTNGTLSSPDGAGSTTAFWAFCTVRGGIGRGNSRFRPRWVEVDVHNIYDPGMRPYPPRLSLALWASANQHQPERSANQHQPVSLGFHKPWGEVSPRGSHRLRLRVVGVVHVWKDLLSGDGSLSLPGGADSTNPGHLQSTREVRVSTPGGAVSFG